MPPGVMEVWIAGVESFNRQRVLPGQLLVATVEIELDQVVDRGGVGVIRSERGLVTVLGQPPFAEAVIGGADVVPRHRKLRLDK